MPLVVSEAVVTAAAVLKVPAVASQALARSSSSISSSNCRFLSSRCSAPPSLLLRSSRSTGPSSVFASISAVRHKSTMAATDSNALLTTCLENNKSWASSISASKPDFFPSSARGQAPKILWLGCADSRVPESLLLGLEPGQIFTHRNIANIITSTDLSAQSIIEFAVGALGVEQVIVCGHTSCGGAAGAMGNASIGAIDVWLTPLRQIRQRLVREGRFEGKSEDERKTLLIEENVRSGVEVVRAHPSVLKAGKSGTMKVHGMVYELGTGLLRELDCGESEDEARARLEAHDTSA